jgi:hypothetical protein
MDLFALTPLRRQVIAEANHFINWLFDSIAAALAPGIARTLPGMKAVFCDYLLPAEAALRRALHILAADLPAPTKKQPPTKPTNPEYPREGGDRAKDTPRARPPTFRLSEPQPRPKTDHLPVRLRPRISIIGVTPRTEPAPRRKLTAIDLEARLRRRFEALIAAFNNPAAAVRRLQRRLAKAGAARPKLAATIPGHTSERIAADGRSVLTRLDESARAPAADTS